MEYNTEDEDWIDKELNLDPHEIDKGKSTLQWSQVTPNFHNTHLAIGEAQQEAWNKAHKEFDHLIKKLPDFVMKDTITDVTFVDLTHIFFGPESCFAKTLMRCLDLDYTTFMRFMDYWCLQAITKRDTYNCAKTLNNILLGTGFKAENILPMEKKVYAEHWKQLCTIGGSGSVEDTIRGGNYAWQLLQHDFNNIMRALYTIENTSHFSIVVDDDKVWFENVGINAEQRYNIKYKQHVRDNRKGFVIHSFVSTALLILVNIQVEQSNDSDRKCLYRGLNSLFGNSSEDSLSIDHNTSVKGDRGYIDDDFVREVTKCAADVSGTCKRLKWYPMTYDQKIGKDDTRTLIPKSGSAALFVYSTKVNNKTISAAAFRNGSDSVACCISSEHHEHEWDGITLSNRLNASTILDPNDFVSMYDRMPIESTEDLSLLYTKEHPILKELHDNHVDVLTLKQQTADWHLRRKFSLTSKQSHNAFHSFFPIPYRMGGSTQKAFVKIAEWIYGSDWKTRAPTLVKPHQETNAADPHYPDQELDSFFKWCTYLNTATSQAQFAKQQVATIWLIPYVRDHKKVTVEEAKAIYDDPQNKKTIDTVKEFLYDRIKPSERVASQPRKDEMIMFMTTTNKIRKWMWYDKEKMKVTRSAFGVTVSSSTSKKAFWTQLAQKEDDFTRDNTLGDSNRTVINDTIRSILASSFHRRFTGAQKKSCSVGNKCEPILIENFVNAVNNGDILIMNDVEKIIGVYTTGLVQKQGAHYVKDSVDFVMIVKRKNQNTYQPMLGEAKTRVSPNTINEEKEFQRRRNRHSLYFSQGSFVDMYKDLRSADERFQVLHHAFTWDLDTVCHVIGGPQGDILHVHQIDFDMGHLKVYGACMKMIYDNCLSWAYRGKGLIAPHVVHEAKKNKNLHDEQAFKSAYFLWSIINHGYRESPLPPLRRIIPRQHSQWNAEKGGSDIDTKLADSLCLLHPNPNLCTRAVNRIMSDAMINIHRLYHLLKKLHTFNDLDSLKQYQDNSSRKHSFLDTICMAREKVFIPTGRGVTVNPTTLGSEARPATPPPPPPARATRANSEQEARRPPYETYSTGYTPISTTVKKRQKMLDPYQNNVFGLRARECPGIMVNMNIDAEDRGYCVVCKSRTMWFCIGCKMWFCNTSNSNASAVKKGWPIREIRHPTKVENIQFYEPCSVKHHTGALTRWKQTTETKMRS